MEDEGIVPRRHEQRITVLEREICELRLVRDEIRAMNESLVILTTELGHTNEHMRGHEERLGELERAPRAHAREIVTAILAALAALCASFLLGIEMEGIEYTQPDYSSSAPPPSPSSYSAPPFSEPNKLKPLYQ